MLLAVLHPVTLLAGPTLTVGGKVENAADGTTPESGLCDVANMTNSTNVNITMTSSNGYWYGEIGHFMTGLSVGDDIVVLIQKETGEGLLRKGYYGVMSKPLTDADPELFDDIFLQEVPVPTIELTGQGAQISYTIVPESGPAGENNIIGSNVYGSADGITFDKLNDATLINSQYLHETMRDTRYYAVALAIRGMDTTVLSSAVRRPYIPGDLDDNALVELKDAILGLQILSGASATTAIKEADVDADGVIGLSDVFYILSHL